MNNYYIEGYDAYYDGIKENPYEAHSNEWNKWEEGFIDAEVDDEE